MEASLGGFIEVMTTSTSEPDNPRRHNQRRHRAHARHVIRSKSHSSVLRTSFQRYVRRAREGQLRPLSAMLDRLRNIRSVAFDWADSPETLGSMAGLPAIGVIAQDVETVFPRP
jgi:hypothetical protein